MAITRPATSGATSVAFSPDGRRLASGTLEGTIKIWEVTTWQLLRTLTGHTSGVTSVADVGGPFWNFEVRDAARASAAAPRVATTGPLISMIPRPALDLGDPPIIKIASPEEARALVARELPRKPDYIKVWFIHEPGDDLGAQEAIVRATAEAAHAAGLRLAVHATELVVAKSALRASGPT